MNSFEYKSLELNPLDINHAKQAKHVAFHSLFVSAHRPRSRLSFYNDERIYLELTAGARVIFLKSQLKEPRVEAHHLLLNCSINFVWMSLLGSLQAKDELELIWMVDSHTTPKMWECGITGDSLQVIVHRGTKQFHHLISVMLCDNPAKRALCGLTRKPSIEELL